MNKPDNIETKFEFTYSELHLFLLLFGTSAAVKAQEVARASDPVACHTDVFVYPLVNQYINEYKTLINGK